MVKNKKLKDDVQKKVENMNREQLERHARSVAQHANRRLREFTKAGMESFHTPTELLKIAEHFNLKTKGERISRSFTKLTDTELRDFVTETKITYLDKDRGSVKGASNLFNSQKLKTLDALEKRFSNFDRSIIENLSNSDFNELYKQLSSKSRSKANDYNSDKVMAEFLTDFNALGSDGEIDIARAFKERQAEEDFIAKYGGNRMRRGSKNRGGNVR